MEEYISTLSPFGDTSIPLQASSSRLLPPQSTSSTYVLHHLSSLYYCFLSRSFSMSIYFSSFDLSTHSYSTICATSTMKKLYTCMLGAVGGPGLKQSQSVVLSASVDGRASRVDTVVLHAHRGSTSHFQQRMLRNHQLGIGYSIALVVMHTACMNGEFQHLCYPYGLYTNDIVPVTLRNKVREGNFTWYLRSMRPSDRATSSVNEDSSAERSMEPFSSRLRALSPRILTVMRLVM